MRNISIIIPFFEKHEAFYQMFSELQLQLHPDDRVIVIDDHSPNGPPEIDCDCTQIIQPPKVTPHIYRLNTLRNLGVEYASHDACLILDPDCVPNIKLLDHTRRIYDPSTLFTGWVWYKDKKGNITKEVRQTGSHEIGKSRWIDGKPDDCRKALGGCMLFSKKRASLAGLFDTAYNGTWGYAEHDFASACYHSGMRLRFEAPLQVTHLWHEVNRPGDMTVNDMLLRNKMREHRESLNHITPYDPAAVVLVVTMMRPYYIDQVMRAVFRHSTPLKVRLVNNGDQSEEQLEEMKHWDRRWAVDYVNYKSRMLLANIRTETMRDYKAKKYKYMVMIDDDITPKHGSINTLIREMEENKQYHALCGYIEDETMKNRFIGGKIRNGVHYYYDPVTPQTMPADYISSGFTIVRLNKVVPYPKDWEMGWNDWCWSNEVKKRGLQVGVTGKAGAYHRQLFTAKGRVYKKDSPEYQKIRRNKHRHDKMAEKFRKKWGYTPGVTRSIRKMK